MCAFAAPTGRQASCGNQSDRLVGLGPLRGGSIERLGTKRICWAALAMSAIGGQAAVAAAHPDVQHLVTCKS